jgi:carboxyl-terminal processing protease
MVEDQTLEDLTASEVVQLIRGEKWTEVTLFIEREWKNKEEIKRFFVTIIRDDLDLPSVTSEVFEINGKNLLYIEISLISEKTTTLLLEEVYDAIQSVGKIDWIILDLRWNEWWYLEEAAKLLWHFFPKDTLLVKSKYKAYEDLDYISKWRWELWSYPIVILVDQLTASASEIIALKFQEEWKTIIWMQTFGKWSIQSVENFTDGSSLKYTVWKWYSPNDVNIDKEWITPDIEVERDYEKYKEDWSDNQLEAAKEQLLKLIE